MKVVGIDLLNGDTKMIEVETSNGFYIHRSISNKDKWTVTHPNSGTAIYKTFRTRKQARVFAKALLSLRPRAFWSQSEDEIRKDKTISLDAYATAYQVCHFIKTLSE